MSRLTRKALLLAKVQVDETTDANPDATNDAVLIGNPEYSMDPEILERDFVSSSISPNPILMGSKQSQLKFDIEVKGNGKQNSGAVADVCKLGMLLRGCATKLTGYATGFALVVPDFDNPVDAPTIAFVAAGNITLTQPTIYTITVSTAGASGAAKVSVTNNNTAEDDVTASPPVTITTATPIDLGAKGGTVTPTFAGDLVIGQSWRVLVCPPCVVANPISANFEGLTLKFNWDGVQHTILDAKGTVTGTCTAGKFGSFTFTFTGKYQTPQDVAFPDDPVFEDTLPPMVEFANLTYQSNNELIVNDFTVDLANTVTKRPSVNHSEGVYGYNITERKPAGGFTPEAELEATVPFWADMGSAARRLFFAKVGTVPGNIVGIFAPSAQTNKLGYQDRDGTLAYDIGLAFSKVNGDDELLFIFM